MLKKIWNMVLAVVFVFSFFVLGDSVTEAAKLKNDYTSTIVMEMVENHYTRVTDITNVTSMSNAVSLMNCERIKSFNKVRIISTDAELLDSWAEAAQFAGYDVEIQELKNQKLDFKTKKLLGQKKMFFFEIKEEKKGFFAKLFN